MDRQNMPSKEKYLTHHDQQSVNNSRLFMLTVCARSSLNTLTYVQVFASKLSLHGSLLIFHIYTH